jgi:hypothetical protein
MPYKAREVLPKLQHAGFVIPANPIRTRSCAIPMDARLRWRCIQAMSRAGRFAPSSSKQE